MAACVCNPSPSNSRDSQPCCESNRTQLDNSLCNYARCRIALQSSVVRAASTGRGMVNTKDQEVDQEEDHEDRVWLRIQDEARSNAVQEPILQGYYSSAIFSHGCMGSALAWNLAQKLGTANLPSHILQGVFYSILIDDAAIRCGAIRDLVAARERDAACISLAHCFLNYKGFLACQAHRLANSLWSSGRKALALLIQSRVSEVFAVDIHPAASIGHGILLDHATGLVIGETAVVGDNVSILHGVTLGATGKASGDRHPKIGDGVLVGAGTHVLGNLRIGEGAKIGAGSVVLTEVPARATAIGNPARLNGGKQRPTDLDEAPSRSMDRAEVDH